MSKLSSFPQVSAGQVSPTDRLVLLKSVGAAWENTALNIQQALIIFSRLYELVAAPDADTDETLGFTVGSLALWAGQVYVCTDATEGAAEWEPVAGATTLGGLSDVDTAGASDGDRLVYDAATETWVPGEPTDTAPTYEPEHYDEGDGSLDGHLEGIDGALGGLLPKLAQLDSKSGNYTLQAGDAGKIIRCTAALTITLPNGLSTGFQAVIVNESSGDVVLDAAGTLNSDGDTLETQHTAATVVHVGSNVWVAFGRLT